VHCESTQVVDRDVDDVCERTEPAGPPGFGDVMSDTGTNRNIIPRVKRDMGNLRKKRHAKNWRGWILQPLQCMLSVVRTSAAPRGC
jgi:hypothetical protein